MEFTVDPRVQATVDAIRQKFAGTAWTVESTPHGVKVSQNYIDAQWWEMARRANLREAYSYSVKFDSTSGTCAITDEIRTIEWKAGVDGVLRPSLSAAAQVYSGRVITVRKTYVATPFEGTVVNSTFNSESARKEIRQVLDHFGWKEKMGLNAKIGLWFAIGGVAFALGVVAFLLVMNPA